MSDLMHRFGAELLFVLIMCSTFKLYKVPIKSRGKLDLSKYSHQMSTLFSKFLLFEHIQLYVPRINIDITEKICF